MASTAQAASTRHIVKSLIAFEDTPQMGRKCLGLVMIKGQRIFAYTWCSQIGSSHIRARTAVGPYIDIIKNGPDTNQTKFAMSLNLDVMIGIMSFLHGSDLLPVMHTCRTLYSAGIPKLMKTSIVLRSRATILSFCRFVLIDPMRFRYLLSLDISAPGRFKKGPKADLLLAMFMHAKYLESLKVADCEILTSDPRIIPVIASMVSLKSLSLHALIDSAFHLLAGLQSELVTIEIGFWRDDATGPVDPIPLLTNYKETLRELRVTYTEFDASNVQYPSLEVLVVDDCRFALAQPLIGCFPNLRDLSLWTGQEDEELEDEEVEEHRRLNIRSQQETSWGYLDHLRGDILSVYLLGVTCRLRHLDVQSTFLTSDRALQLVILIANGQPCDLSIRIKFSRCTIPILTEVLSPVSEILIRLVLYLHFPGSSTASDGQHLERLVLALRASRMECLILHLSWDDVLNSWTHNELYLEAISRTAIRNIPSVQRLFVTLDQECTQCWAFNPGTGSLYKTSRDVIRMYYP